MSALPQVGGGTEVASAHGLMGHGDSSLWPRISWEEPFASPRQRLKCGAILGWSHHNWMSTYRASAWSFLQTFPAGSPRQWLRCFTLTESICLHSFADEKQHVAEAYLKRDFHSCRASWSTARGTLPAFGRSPTHGLEVVHLSTSHPRGPKVVLSVLNLQGVRVRVCVHARVCV